MKKGTHSSEFWLTAFANILGASAIFLGSLPQTNEKVATASIIVGGLINALALFGYQAKRTALKIEELKK